MVLKNKGLIAIHFSVLLFGVAGIFGKLLDQPPLIIVLGRVFFASLFLAVLLLYSKQNIKLKQNSDYFFLIFQGIILAFHWFTFFKSIQVSTVAIGLLTFSTFPVFTTFIEPIFTNERLKLSAIIIACVTFGGVILVIPDFKPDNNLTQGALWGIASGFSFSVLTILNRKFTKNYSSLIIAFYQDFTATLALFPFIFFIQPVIGAKDIWLLVLLGVVFTAVAHSLFISGLTTVKAQVASIIACLEPVYGIIFAIFLINEFPTIRIVAGGIIILGATFYTTKISKSST